MAELRIPEPSEKQCLFMADRHKYIGYGGARGGGKSWAVRVKAVLLCLRYAGIKVMIIRKTYPDVEVLMGTSTAGIAHAAITAHIMGLPMGYVRSGAKDHGRQNQIEGKLEAGQKVVVVEDLISTGGSVIEVVNVLREAGAEVLGVVSIFTYGMQKGLDRLREANVKNVSLTNFDVIAQAAADEGYIAQEAVKRLIQFRNNPSDESWIQK